MTCPNRNDSDIETYIDGDMLGGLGEAMTDPADRAVLLLQKVSELLLESRGIVKELEVVPDGESSANTAD